MKFLALSALAVLCCSCVHHRSEDKRGDAAPGTPGEEQPPAEDSTANRPDSNNVKPPGWYVAGAVFSSADTLDGENVVGKADMKDLPVQTCAFAQIAGIDHFILTFADKEGDDETRELRFALPTATLPVKDSTYLFKEKSHADDGIVLMSFNTGDNLIWTTNPQTAQLPDCQFVVAETDERADEDYFFLRGTLSCARLPELVAEKRALRFTAAVGCAGQVVKITSREPVKEATFTDEKSHATWRFLKTGTYGATTAACAALNDGSRLPDPEEVEAAGDALVKSDVGAAIGNTALFPQFLWTRKDAVNLASIAVVMEYQEGDPGVYHFQEATGEDKDRAIGSVVCIKP